MAAIDITDARELTKVVNNNLAPHRFLTSFFQVQTHNTKDVLIDFVEGSTTIAPYIRDGAESTISNRGGYSSRNIHCYDISLKRRTTAFDALKRLPGEAPIVEGAKSPSERCAELVASDLRDLQNVVNRSIEKAVSDSIFTGSLSIKDADGKVIDSLTLGLKDSHNKIKDAPATPTGTDKLDWSSTSTAISILGDIEDMASLIGQDSGLTATDIIVGSDVAKTILGNEKFLKNLDTKYLDAGSLEIAPMQNRGARLLGLVGGLRLWRYDEIYKEGSTTSPMVPAKKLVVLSNELKATLHYGVAGDIENGFYEGEFAVSTWYEKDPSVQWLRVRSAPLPVIEQIDGLVVASI